MRKLLHYLKPYWLAAVLAPLMMLGEVFFDLMQPQLLANIVDNGVMTGDLEYIQRTGGVMLLFALGGLITGIGCAIFASMASMKFGADIRAGLFRKVQASSFRNLENWSTGSLITRLTADVVQVQNFVQMLLRAMVRAPFTAIGSLIMAIMISVKLSMILVIAIPLLFTLSLVIVRKGFPLFAKVQVALDGVNNVLRENLAGIRVVKAFVRADSEKKRFERVNHDYMASSIKANLIMATLMPILMLVLNICVVLVLGLGGRMHISDTLPVGDLIAYINYVTQMLSSFMMVSMMIVSVTRARASANRIVEVLDSQSEIVEQPAALPSAAPREVGRIVLDQVSFSYDPGKPVLKNISFTAEPGQTVAILGATGSGKTTLVSLIPRLYEVESGAVYVDGVNVRDMPLRELRSRIGYVMQEAILFSGTIRENIRFGRPNATDEQVEAAAMAAEAHGFIMEFKEGYETMIGQKGVNLSGGQKQRLSISRALLIEPEVIIMDDSTSAVDLGTESRIQQALKNLTHRSTCILIAQRVSSVMEADRILVMDEGEIVASGTHEQLRKSSSVYQEICESQLRKDESIA